MRSVSKMLTECPGWVRVGGEEGQTHLVIYLFIKYVLSDFFYKPETALDPSVNKTHMVCVLMQFSLKVQRERKPFKKESI